MHAREFMIFCDRSQNDIIITTYIQSLLIMRPKLYKLSQTLFQPIRAKFTCMRVFTANYIKGNIQMHLYLKFERKILKIGKVIAVLIEFLNSRAPTCMHVHEK